MVKLIIFSGFLLMSTYSLELTFNKVLLCSSDESSDTVIGMFVILQSLITYPWQLQTYCGKGQIHLGSFLGIRRYADRVQLPLLPVGESLLGSLVFSID